jgi:uncharacterized membrane protein YraQ (UPF0718 family)
MQNLLTDMSAAVVGSLNHNGLYLVLGILIAAILKVLVDPEKIRRTLIRRKNLSIPAGVAFGAFTPLCACGTMAVVLGLLSTALPWGPIMAFLTSSPLMSPDGFVMIAGMISLRFAVALALASIVIGLGSGYLTSLIEKRTDFLKNQTRFADKPKAGSCGCAGAAPAPARPFHPVRLCCAALDGYQVAASCAPACGRTSAAAGSMDFMRGIKWRELADALVNIGFRQILPYYSLFVAIGFLINRWVPASIIVSLFSAGNPFAVPMAALIGLPIYVNGESAIPLIKTMMAGGASGGAMLAFLITGPGTSAGVIAGISTIMKKRAIVLYVLFLLAGGILLGYLYDLFLMTGL